jgi:hypothetical protein
MEKGFLLDGINVSRHHAGMHQRVIGAAAVFTHAAIAALPVVDDAFAWAELAFDFPVGLFIVKPGFLDELRVVLRERSSEDGDSILPSDNCTGAGGEAGKGSSLQKSSPVEGEAAGFFGAHSRCPRRGLEESQIIFHCHQTSTTLMLWGSLVPRPCCGSAAVEM